MNSPSFLLEPVNHIDQSYLNFCRSFLHDASRPKYLFGRNIFAEKLLESVHVDGFIDDFTTESTHLGRPIVSLKDVPSNSLVLILSGGNTQTVSQKVKARGVEYLDYFMFSKLADIPLTPIPFWDTPKTDFDAHANRYETIYSRLSDQVSRSTFKQLINFKYTHDLRFMSGFSNRESEQYFEPFLRLSPDSECFIDVGAYDGFTSECFSLLCPQYHSIHLFEPDTTNLELARTRLQHLSRIKFYPYGLDSKKRQLSFNPMGSGSHISAQGKLTITVNKLDALLDENIPASFIKMDIEGAELAALDGAKKTILKHHPKLAISVYHHACDMWKVPEKVLSIRDDYDLYLRHYTETLYESVMFFIPRTR